MGGLLTKRNTNTQSERKRRRLEFRLERHWKERQCFPELLAEIVQKQLIRQYQYKPVAEYVYNGITDLTYFDFLPKEQNVLLLGAGEQGKRTYFEASTTLHLQRSDHKKSVPLQLRKNIEEAIYELPNMLDRSGIPINQIESSNLETIQLLRNMHPFDKSLIARFDVLLKEPVIKEFLNSSVFFLNCRNVFDHLWIYAIPFLKEKFAGLFEDPMTCDLSNVEYLYYRSRFTGIDESKIGDDGEVDETMAFEYERDYERKEKGRILRVVMTGGQRNERKKWVQCFENVHHLVIIISIDCYHKKLFEDRETNQMQENMNLFQEIVNNPAFSRLYGFSVILTRGDMLSCKIRGGLFPGVDKETWEQPDFHVRRQLIIEKAYDKIEDEWICYIKKKLRGIGISAGNRRVRVLGPFNHLEDEEMCLDSLKMACGRFRAPEWDEYDKEAFFPLTLNKSGLLL
jgi:hypothetical protein